MWCVYGKKFTGTCLIDHKGNKLWRLDLAYCCTYEMEQLVRYSVKPTRTELPDLVNLIKCPCVWIMPVATNFAMQI